VVDSIPYHDFHVEMKAEKSHPFQVTSPFRLAYTHMRAHVQHKFCALAVHVEQLMNSKGRQLKDRTY